MPPRTPRPLPSNHPTQDPGEITVYSGRSESLVGALLEQFEADTGIRVKVRYAGTAQLAVAILEEGSRSPADVYFAQDAGALGALADAGALVALPSALLDRVDPDFRDAQGRWVGIVRPRPRARHLHRARRRRACLGLRSDQARVARPHRLGPHQRLVSGVRDRHATAPRRRCHGAVATRHARQRGPRVPRQLPAGPGGR